jgi:hypothetical protein
MMTNFLPKEEQSNVYVIPVNERNNNVSKHLPLKDSGEPK